MASFTDQIMQFNPYVQQLPVEAMAQVGMYKQQKYEEGVQKVQSYIDNIAGLDVMKDVDKQYLQSKLNQLGSKLRSVAAGDFSNFQLVNSVGGMATQVVKDPLVQNSVQSTAWYRKQREKIQKDIDEGKSNPANIDKFDKQASIWLNDKNPGQKFSGQYNPFFDVDKFVKETFDAVKPDGYTSEMIYETDTSGRILIDPKTKKPIFSPVMTRLEQDGRFPKTVKDTLEQIFSDPRVTQQLQINGEYNYKNFEGDNLKALAKEMTDKKLSVYDLALAELNIKKSTGEDVQAEIDAVENKRKKAQISLNEVIELANTNPDALRGMLYKDDVYDNWTTMYGTIKEKRTTHENPGWNQMFKQQQEINDQKQHSEMMGYNWAKLRQDDRHHTDNVRLQMLKAAGGKTPKDDGRLPVPTDIASDVSIISIEEEAFNNAAEGFNNSVYELIIQSGALTNEVNKTIQNFGGKITPNDAVRKIAEQNSKKLGYTPQQYTEWLYNKALTQLNSVGDANLSTTQRAAKKSAENAQVNFKNALNIRKTIDEKVGPSKMLDITRSLRTEEFTLPGGSIVRLNPQDQYDIAMAYSGSDWYESADVKAEAAASQKRLSAKGINENIVRTIMNQANSPYEEDPKTGREVVPLKNRKAATAIKNLRGIVDRTENVTNIKSRAEVIKGFYQINPILEKSLVTGDSGTDKLRAADVLMLIGKYTRAGLQESPNFLANAPMMSQITTGALKGSYSIVAKKDEVSGRIVPKVVFTKEDGGFAGDMTITSDEAALLGQNVNQWWQPESVRQAQIALDATGNGTTALSGNVNDARTYLDGDVLYNKSQFRNLRGIADDVKANISVQPYFDENNQVSLLYYGHVFVNGANGKAYKPVSLPAVSSMAEVLEQFNGLTPQMIEQLKIEGKNKK
jgi:hypothetical protein